MPLHGVYRGSVAKHRYKLAVINAVQRNILLPMNQKALCGIKSEKYCFSPTCTRESIDIVSISMKILFFKKSYILIIIAVKLLEEADIKSYDK